MVIVDHHVSVTFVHVDCWVVARLLLWGGQLSSRVQLECRLWEETKSPVVLLRTRAAVECLRVQTQEEVVETTTVATKSVSSPLSEEEPVKHLVFGVDSPELRVAA